MENKWVVKKSTLWKGAVILFIVVLGFFTFRNSFGKDLTGNVIADPYADLSFKEVCSKTGGMWMRMQPTQNYAPTGQPACSGCMQRGGDHICGKERYIQTLRK